jgi:acetoin utilization deacetylase AcuC-like enzyme
VTTGFVYHPDCLAHRPGPVHPERPERVQAIHAHFEQSGLLAELDVLAPAPAEAAWIRAVHPAEHVQQVAAACVQGLALDPDTGVSRGSLRAAELAAGGAVEAAARVLDGRWTEAFVACRPPGHHAETARAMGFCLYNSAAIAATWLRAQGVERVAILDWDVHHGNGTQQIFERDPNVYYASLHQHPLYPGSGARDERGLGAGAGTTLNCPQPAGATELEWLRALEQQILPEFERFAPSFVIVSAGFDAHVRDPLAQTRLETASFARLTRGVLDFARARCEGRIVSLLEGGYDLGALADSTAAHVEEYLRT